MLLDHLNPELAKPITDPALFRLYERNFGVTLPRDFESVMSAYNDAVVCGVFVHPDLPIDENEFCLFRFLRIGLHKFNEPTDLLVRTEFEHYNQKTIPKRVLVFGFDYRDWPIYLDLTEGGEGRIVVHENDERLPSPSWANQDHAYPCVYIADGFSDYIRSLVPDPNPPI